MCVLIFSCDIRSRSDSITHCQYCLYLVLKNFKALEGKTALRSEDNLVMRANVSLLMMTVGSLDLAKALETANLAK